MTARTGSPPGMLQDDSRDLSRWLAGQPDALRHAREAAAAIALDRVADKAARRRFDPTPATPTAFGHLGD